MGKTLLLILMIFVFSDHAVSQKRNSILIESPLVKKIEFKDTSIEEAKVMYHKCQSWKLTYKEAHEIFSLAKPISSEQKQDMYSWLPCYYTAKVTYKGSSYKMEINAAAFISLYNNKSTIYFGCGSQKCNKFFILSRGRASED